MDFKELHPKYACYYYLVSEFVTTFSADPAQSKPFSHDTIFNKEDLLKSREEAFSYYHTQLLASQQGKYALPFESPQDFELGKHAAFSISIYFVEYFNENHCNDYDLQNMDEKVESLATEALILKRLGY